MQFINLLTFRAGVVTQMKGFQQYFFSFFVFHIGFIYRFLWANLKSNYHASE